MQDTILVGYSAELQRWSCLKRRTGPCYIPKSYISSGTGAVTDTEVTCLDCTDVPSAQYCSSIRVCGINEVLPEHANMQRPCVFCIDSFQRLQFNEDK